MTMSASPWGLVVIPVLGIALVVVAILVIVFALVARATRAAVAKVADEGVVRRSGFCFITIRLHNYRDARRRASYRVSRNRGELLLLRDALVVVSGLATHRFARPALPHAEAWSQGEKLHFRSDRPTAATGEVEISIAVPDANDWVRELAAAGAQTRSPS